MVKRKAPETPTKKSEAGEAEETQAPLEEKKGATPKKGAAKKAATPKKGAAKKGATPKKGAKGATPKKPAKKKQVKKEGKVKDKEKGKKATVAPKSKAKALAVLKKPASKKEEKEEEQQQEKKKEKTLVEKTAAWETAAEGEEAAAAVTSEEEQETRDAGKAKKWRKMADAGAIPAHILDLINEQSKKATNPRKEKTALINGLFVKNSKGGYDMQADSPVFQPAKTAFDQRYGKKEQTGMPKDVFLWQTFHGNEVALAAAIEKGSVEEYEEEGTTFCSFKKSKVGVTSGCNTEMKVSGGDKDLDDKQYKTLTRAFSSLALELGDSDKEDDKASKPSGSSSAAGAKPKALKSLEAAGLTESMAAVLAEAKGAHEKLHVQAMKLLGKCSSDSDKKKFKETVLSIKSWIQKNENVLTWKDFWISK